MNITSISYHDLIHETFQNNVCRGHRAAPICLEPSKAASRCCSPDKNEDYHSRFRGKSEDTNVDAEANPNNKYHVSLQVFSAQMTSNAFVASKAQGLACLEGVLFGAMLGSLFVVLWVTAVHVWRKQRLRGESR
jgi:hypothetical protein